MLRDYLLAVVFGTIAYVLAYVAQWAVAASLNGSPSVILFVAVVLTTAMAVGLGWMVQRNRGLATVRSDDREGPR